MKHTVLLIFAVVILFGGDALAQEETSGVMLRGRATREGSIRLRWAPNSPALWQLANKYGYTIERIAITENDRLVGNRAPVILNALPLKPADQSYWEEVLDSDDYVAVAAQAIFGETFEVIEHQSEMMQVVTKARELESRFSFALFAADQSRKAAELSGLYFEDEKIAPGTRYLYRVYANIPDHIHKADTGIVLVGLPDYKPLPPLRDLQVEFNDHLALLSWDGASVENIYNSFFVERSDDGSKTFRRVSDQPIVNTFAADRPRTRLIFKTDSLPSNDVTYHYRVIGINAFGETGPPSDTVSGAGRPVFGYSASVSSHVVNSDGSVTLEFAFPEEGQRLLQSFDLLRVDPKTKESEAIKTDLRPDTRTVHDSSPHSTNYYVISARDRYGRSNRSFPYLVQLEDSIPPSAPEGLTGRIDTLGHVYLDWKPNPEADLLGYAIYRANFKSEEFLQLKGSIREVNTYVDTIGLDNLTEKIYYKVTAIDRRYNYSSFSEVVELSKPDLIAPAPPVFTAIRNDSNGIALDWVPSGSDDVVKHLLYRKGEDEVEWTLIKIIEAADTEVIKDADVKHRVQYAYTLLAVDDAGLESTPAQPVALRRVVSTPYPEVTQLYSKLDRSRRTITISWNYHEPEVEHFVIYRAVNGGPPALYKSVDGSKREYIDGFSLSDATIEYRIVATFRSGERTNASRAIAVKL